MIPRVLTLGLIGIVLINEVAGVIDAQNGGFIVVKRPNANDPNDMGENNYVDENLDDLEPNEKPKIFDPENEFDPSSGVIYLDDNSTQITEKKPTISNRFGGNSEEPNIAAEKPKPTEKAPLNNEAQPGYVYQCALCKKIDQAWKNAHKEVDKNFESLVNAGRLVVETKMKWLQSLPEAGRTFFRTLMNRGEKS